MSLRATRSALVGLAALFGTLILAHSAQAAAPLYDIKATWGDTYLTPGDTNATTAEGQFAIQARNIGDAAGGGEDLVIEDKLPAKVTATAIHWANSVEDFSGDCSGAGTGTVRCVLPAALVPKLAPAPGGDVGGLVELLPSGYLPTVFVDVSVAANASGPGTNVATLEGGGGAAPVKDTDQITFSKTPSPFGLVPGSFETDAFDAAFPAQTPSRKASGHPFELRTKFDITAKTGVNPGTDGDTSRYITPNGQVRTVETTLPRGVIVNPEATPKCDPTDFARAGASVLATACPPNTQVGYLNVSLRSGTHNYGEGTYHQNSSSLGARIAIYNLKPPKGVPADLAFSAAGIVQGHIYGNPDPAQRYAIKAVVPNITTLVQARGAEATFWGVPADPAHDKFRFRTAPNSEGNGLGASWGTAPIRPLITNPADCGSDNGGARARIDSYNHPDQFSEVSEYGDHFNVNKCDDPRFRFEPEVSLQPTSREAGGPTGLDVHLKVPQRNDEVTDAKDLYTASDAVEAVATPPMKEAVVTFPKGMTINPSAAQGLGYCTPAQIGLGTDSKVECPDDSQYGTLTVHTPILPSDAQPEGWIYIAKQNDNPYHNFLSLYMVIQEPERGILIKVPARLDLDPQSGQITTTFEDLPQFPVSDLQLTLKGGLRAGLVNPQTCGQKTITATFYSWQDPTTPHTVKSSYDVTQNPNGSPCLASLAQRPFSPTFEGGTQNPIGGAYSPLAMRFTRTDEDQEFSRLGVSLPEGLLAKLSGVGRCPEAAIAQAQEPGRSGAEERVNPSCPASSLLGQTQAGTGVGVPLTYVPGSIYLAGPYRGAPLSIVAITPAVAGPFDLGVIAVRAALEVNPETTRASVKTDPLPLIFKGVPVRARDIRVNTDRPGFTLNPTGCTEKHLDANVIGTGGDLGTSADDTSVNLSSRFQLADCSLLRFKPRLSFRLSGGTHRGAHPGLRAVFKGRPGDANLASASVALPHSEFLDQAHIKTVCTRVQFAAQSCPAGSIYGRVSAKSPLFDEAFTGPIYLRSSSHPLPDLVAALKGPASLPVEVDLAGRIDSVHGGIRNTFQFVPDVPVSSAVFTFQGGAKGLLVNSTNLCAGAHRATASFKAQNGSKVTLRPQLQASCKGRSTP